MRSRFPAAVGLFALAVTGCRQEAETPPVPDPPFPVAAAVEVVVFEGDSCRLLFPVSIVVSDAPTSTAGGGTVRFRGELAQATLAGARDGAVVLGAQSFASPIEVRLEPLSGEVVEGVPAIGVRTEAATRYYRGALRLERHSDALRVVNLLNLEQYVVGVVASEMPLSYPLESLKAQAVAARTFALYELVWQRDHGGLRPFGADTSFQVYRGVRAGDRRAVDAVLATSGEVLFYGGALFRSYFHSTCGGRTVPAAAVFGDADIPPLGGAPCGACLDSPTARWESRWSLPDLEAVLVPWARAEGEWIGTLRGLEVADLDDAGRVRSLLVRGATRSVEISASRLRKLLERDGRIELRSATFTIEEGGGNVTFRGEGFGHRVGLCQVGAGARGVAERYDDILARYYPGSDVLLVGSLY